MQNRSCKTQHSGLKSQNRIFIMSLILNIDTSTERAGICLSAAGEVLSVVYNNEQKDHASWIQVAIRDLVRDARYSLQQLQAVAVTEGPGSYTGLRVGMSTAKGICYALKIPLITESTLLVMAHAARSVWAPDIEKLKKVISVKNSPDTASVLLCPMIDARRMEVFTALYNESLEAIMPAKALILEVETFKEALNKHLIIFFGSGSDKWKPLCIDNQAQYKEGVLPIVESLSKLAAARLSGQLTADLAYVEPVYLKDFYSYTKKQPK
jgi:tRNA threonylcarbamoyladenosine biosynthesis protein TsaB